MVRKIKFETSLEDSCTSFNDDDFGGYGFGGDYDYDNIPDDSSSSVQGNKVEALEQLLKIEPSELLMKNMTPEVLKTAAEMFLYLYSCPEKLKPWFLFYNDLFQSHSAHQIILTLNRMMKGTLTPHNIFFKKMSKDLFKKASYLFPLKYKEIQSLMRTNAKNYDISKMLGSKGKRFSKVNVTNKYT